MHTRLEGITPVRNGKNAETRTQRNSLSCLVLSLSKGAACGAGPELVEGSIVEVVEGQFQNNQ